MGTTRWQHHTPMCHTTTVVCSKRPEQQQAGIVWGAPAQPVQTQLSSCGVTPQLTYWHHMDDFQLIEQYWPTNWTCKANPRIKAIRCCGVLPRWCSSVLEEHFEWYNLNWKHIWQLVYFITKREMIMYITLTLNINISVEYTLNRMNKKTGNEYSNLGYRK